MKWSYGIVLAYVLFISFILSLVYKTFQNDVDLVADDYYAKELAFQDIIDGQKNYFGLNKSLILHQTLDSITVFFPHISSENITGNVQFFRPSNKGWDQNYSIENQVLRLSKTDYKSGQYIMKATWNVAGIEYYHEQPLFVQK